MVVGGGRNNVLVLIFLGGGTRPGHLEEQLAIRTNNYKTIARGTSDLPLSNARDNILFAGDHKNVIRQTSFREPIFISHGSNEDVTSSRTSGTFRQSAIPHALYGTS